MTSQALLPDYGKTLGTLVFHSRDTIDGSTKLNLMAQGYGISTFSEPIPDEEFDIDSYREMFAEWGWSSAQAKKSEWTA